MDTKEIIYGLRTKKGMSQDELAERVFVTRQAVSRWENGETVPNTETLKLLSRVFDVSINTLLGAPRQQICQCCGMPLEDDGLLGRNADGTLNENYCRWCYADGAFTYSDPDALIEVCIRHMVGESFTEEQARSYMRGLLPTLEHWKQHDAHGDNGQFDQLRQQLLAEINALPIEGLPRVETLYALVGKDVNLAYRLPSGATVKFLDDEKTYLGNQLERTDGKERYFGIIGSRDFLLVSTYEKDGQNPELLFYRKRADCPKNA